MRQQKTITYVTSSTYKIEECRLFQSSCTLNDGTPVSQCFNFEYRAEQIKETLEVNLEAMVKAEVIEAYSKIKVPCIVEHAGLIFDRYKFDSYPGGLTKAMWDTLGPSFIGETNSAGKEAVARAVVAYCDGKSVKTFVGETDGKLAVQPRGKREFYWDTVFIPIEQSCDSNEKTYAEIIDDPELGLLYKVDQFSQSFRAMRKYLDYLLRNPQSDLWA